MPELQTYEIELRKQLRQLREIQFYHSQHSQAALAEIEELLESIREGSLIGREIYAPAYFEWAIWRLFLAINALVGPMDWRQLAWRAVVFISPALARYSAR